MPCRSGAASLVAACTLAACGGSGNDPTANATPPQLRLTVTATEDFAGSYGTSAPTRS